MSLNVMYEQREQDIVFLSGRHHVDAPPHLHRELEVIALLEGDVLACADSLHCEMHAGDLFFSFPNQIHSYEQLTPETHVGFLFKPDLVPEMMELFTVGLPKSPVIVGGANDPRIRALLDALLETRTRGSFPYLHELRRGYLLALCSEVLPRMDVAKLPGDSEALRAIVSFCTRNFAENLSLSLLEEKLHLNKYYISHLFCDKLGLRFNDYINSLRISEACRYLSGSAHSVTEIALLVGFNTSRTFNRAFVRQMGESPTDYRRRKLAQTGKEARAPRPPAQAVSPSLHPGAHEGGRDGDAAGKDLCCCP